MEENKKKVLIIIGFILIIIAIITILLSSFIKENDNNINEPNDNLNIENSIQKDIENLTNESRFFSLQKAINDFYLMLNSQETDKILSILDKDYINSKNVNNSNLYNNISSNYGMTSFVVQNIYYNPNSITTYYFINGYLTDIDMMGEDNKYYENINYLIIVDETSKNYTITPLENNLNLQDYAQKYNIVKKEIENGFSLSIVNMSEENKLTLYINEFLNLLIYDNNRAYNLLEDETKKYYQSVSIFKNQMIDIYSRFSSKIFSYSKNEEGDITTYYIKDDKQNSITITEYGIMNYKISY